MNAQDAHNTTHTCIDSLRCRHTHTHAHICACVRVVPLATHECTMHNNQ